MKIFNTKQPKSFLDKYRALMAVFILVLITSFAHAQTIPYDSNKQRQPVKTYGNDFYGNYRFGTTLVIPTQDTIHLATKDSGAMTFHNGVIYGFDGYHWNAFGVSSTPVDTTGQFVTDIIRIPGVDSFFFRKGGILYGVKDSIGSGGSGSTSLKSYTGGYRLIKSGSDSVKVLTAGTGITLDSSTNGTVRITNSVLVSDSAWMKGGNSGTSPGTNFIGTTDSVDFVGKANGIEQIRLLASGGISIPATTGNSTGVIFRGSNRFIHSFQLSGTSTTLGENLFIGKNSGNFTMTGSFGGFGTRNTAVGDSTLFANTTGYRNVAIGVWAGAANTSGFENTIVGANASQKSTSRQNTAIGAISMTNTTTGERNVAVGFSTLEGNTTGSRNTAIGGRAMQNTVSSFANIAVGFDALAYTVAGDHNVGVGLDALYFSDGTHNVAIGDSTLWGLFGMGIKNMGYKNVAVGSRAGYHLGDTYPNFASIYDTACIFLGGNASRDSSIPYATSLQNMIVIGTDARGSASNQVVLGNDNITTTLLKGKVGLGTTTPDSTLHVVGGLHTTGGVRFTGLIAGLADTTTYKPVGINSSGTLASMASWPAGSGGGSGITVGTTTITSGTSGRVGYNNAGVYGESANLFWDNSNNRLSIQSGSSPESPIDVTGGSGTSDVSIRGFTLRTTNTSYPTAGRWGVNFNGSYFTQNAYYNGSWNNDNAGVGSSGILLNNFAGAEYMSFNVSDVGGIPDNGGTPRMRVNLTHVGIADGLYIGSVSTAPAASAILDAPSTTRGFLPPRMTTTQKNAISSPAEGLIVYDTTLHKLCVYTGSAWETVTSLTFEWIFFLVLLPTLLFRRKQFYNSINKAA